MQVHKTVVKAKENLRHRRFGHLGEQGLKQLARGDFVRGFDYNLSRDIEFCEDCVSGKIHRKPFPTTGRQKATEPLGLVHSDVCRKINSPSLGKAEFFVTFSHTMFRSML